MTPDEFRAVRLKLGLTQTRWGYCLGLKRREVQYLESGEHHVTRTQQHLCELFCGFGGWLHQWIETCRRHDRWTCQHLPTPPPRNIGRPPLT